MEVFRTIVLLSDQNACIHQRENDLTHVLRAVESPMFEDRSSQEAESFDGEGPNALCQLRTRNVARLFHTADHVMQGRQNEQVCLPLEARIPLLQAIEDLVGELNVGHGRKLASTPP